jgi:type VI secretion system secreted protein Hcp
VAIDMFIKIGQIEGESKDATHAGEMDVLAYSLGFSNSGTTHAGSGAGAGKVNAQDLSFTTYVSKASLPLFTAVCTGRIFTAATLTIRRAGANPFEFLKIRMEDVLVSSDSSGGSGGEDRLVENYSLNYARIIFTYTGQDATGAPLPPIRAGFDFVNNVKI